MRNINSIPLHDLQRLADNPKIAANLKDIFPSPYTLDDAREFIRLTKEGLLGNIFGIFSHETFIGVGGIVPQKDVYRNNGEIGYWIGEPFWGKGYASQTVNLLTCYAFNELKLFRVFAGVFSGNLASMKALEKNGYQLDAIVKSAIIKNGQILDEYLYSILSVF